jgi:hypothetical protein
MAPARGPIRPIAGRDLKDLFTKRARGRYQWAMLLLAAILAMSQPDIPPPTRGATAHAQAIIRIVSAVRVNFDQRATKDVPPPRETVVHGQGRELLRAKLVEFE